MREAVNGLIERLLDDVVAADPGLATCLGMTVGMDRLPSYSEAGVRRVTGWAQSYGARFRELAETDDVEAAIDAVTGAQIAARFGRELGARRAHRRNPMVYLDALHSILLLMIKEIAPPEERLAAVEGRLRAAPGLLEEARANLVEPLPRAYVVASLDAGPGAAALVGEAVREFAAACGRAGALDAAAAAACTAVEQFISHLRETVLPSAHDDCAAGREVLVDILRHEHLLGETPEELAAAGRAAMDETRALMEELAASMGFATVAEAVVAVQSDHPPTRELVGSYRDAVIDARRYVAEHDLVTLPAEEELVVEATPPFLRALLPFAAYEGPGPFESRQRGFYWVTPPRDGLVADELERALRGHPFASMPTVGVHEAYPGHHVQFVRANRARTLARRIAWIPTGGTMLVEGWAFYCEELMEREGLLAGPAVRLMRLNDQMWRACRVVIDMEVHTSRMTFDEAVDLLAREAHMGRREAELEVRWYVAAPGYPMCYLIGKREVMALAADFVGTGSDSRKAFHDALLDWGALSPALIRWGMGLGSRPAF